MSNLVLKSNIKDNGVSGTHLKIGVENTAKLIKIIADFLNTAMAGAAIQYLKLVNFQTAVTQKTQNQTAIENNEIYFSTILISIELCKIFCKYFNRYLRKILF